MLNPIRWSQDWLPEREPSSTRWDIQGIRAAAVIAVILDHLAEWPRGGFIGVDVFFVVSGFLISGQLVRSAETKGLRFGDFYRRRARRILPAATLAIVATIGAAFYFVNEAVGKDVSFDGLWAFFFAANWHFADVGTDYFANNAITSPLQHYWSLSVEEQFYFVWPLLIIAFFGIGRWRRTGPPARRLLGVAMVLVCLASFAYACWHAGSSPTDAYFSTFDRAWELGVGALLALAAPAVSRIREDGALRPVLAWLGLAGIVVSLFVIDSSMPFPGPWAALPVLSTALIIAAGTFSERGRQQRAFPVLTNRLSTYLGDISYSLYLWHFPVAIILPAVMVEEDAAFYATAVVTMLTLSMACYHFIEDPIHHSNWLEPRARNRRGHRVRSPERFALPRRAQVTLAGMAGIVVVFLSAASIQSVPTISTGSDLSLDSPPPTATAAPGAGHLPPLVGVEQERIKEALDADDFPKLSPPVENLGFDQWVEDFRAAGYCDYEINADTASGCIFGPESATKTAALMGDSYAMAWMPGLVSAFGDNGYRTQQLTMAECPVWDVQVQHGDGSAFPECDAHRGDAIEIAKATHPDLLILSTADTTIDRMELGGTIAETVSKGLGDTLAALEGAARRIVVLGSPPSSQGLEGCYSRYASPSDCIVSITAEWTEVRDAERATAKAAGVKYVEVSPWFCDAESNECPSFIGDTPVSVDGHHLTLDFAEEIAPLISEALFRR